MKKQTAIFVLSVFFLAQFGKVINFCFCKAAAYQQTKTFTCDCEKQLYTLNNTDKAPREQTTHTIGAHLSTEELFHLSNAIAYTAPHSKCITAWPVTGNEMLYHIFGNAVFRPPLQFS